MEALAEPRRVASHATFSRSFRISGSVAFPVRGSALPAILIVHDAVVVESNHACDCASRDLLDHQHVPVIDSSQIEVPVAERYLQFDAVLEETHLREDSGALLNDVCFARLTRKSGVHPKVLGVLDDALPGIAARPDSDEFRVVGRLALVSFGCPASSWGPGAGRQCRDCDGGPRPNPERLPCASGAAFPYAGPPVKRAGVMGGPPPGTLPGGEGSGFGACHP